MSKMLTELMAERDALNERIANFKPLTHSLAVKKLHTYVAKYTMTAEELFPTHYQADTDYETAPEMPPDFWEEGIPEFEYEDTFGYTLIAVLKAQRNELNAEIHAIRREALERARAFIREYDFYEEDVFPSIEK